MKSAFAVLFLLAVGIFAASDLEADSVLGAGHFGIPVQPADARSRALGGASAALPGEDFSFTNTARTVNFRRSGFNGLISQNYRTLKGASSTDRLRSTEFQSFRAVFPSIKRFVFSWGIFQCRDLDWKMGDRIVVPVLNDELERSYSSDGGMFVSRIGIARTVAPHLALGLGLDWMLGRTRQWRKLDFSNDDLLDSAEQYKYSYSCFRPSFSVLTGYSKFSVGFSLTVPGTSNIDKTSIYTSGFNEKETMQLDLPFSWRLGTAVSITRRSLLAVDLECEGWGSRDFRLDPLYEHTDQWRFCLGYEILPATGEQRPFYRRVPLRMGYSRTTYPFKIAGQRVGEQFITFGTGMYFGGGNGLVDIAVEIGRRKAYAEGLPEESLVRFTVSMSAFEKWLP
ncbi:MAG: hypothetical protein U9P14_10700, partial [Gemmatimonadota bacterium]|nr:hypothetical protein [Gemmatimonadota bacterium]